MKTLSTNAMILAAGFGTRLRPITHSLPKPALPLLNIPLIHIHLASLFRAGFRSTFVNLHHLENVMQKTADSCIVDVERHYSREQEILGTGGGIKRIWPDMTQEHLLVVNGDIVFTPDLRELINLHQQRQALATLVLRHAPDAESYGLLEVDDSGRIITLPSCPNRSGITADSGMFTGVHILSREIERAFPTQDSFCIVRDVYAPLVAAGAPIFAVFIDSLWNDAGTKERFFNSTMELLASPSLIVWPEIPGTPRPDKERRLIHPTATIAKTVTLGNNVVIGPQVSLAGNMTLSDVIVLPETSLTADAAIRREILYRNCRLPIPT